MQKVSATFTINKNYRPFHALFAMYALRKNF